MIRRAFATVLPAAVVFLALAAAPAFAGFYDVDPGELAGPPGSIIRAEVMDIGTPGASTFRILYRSVAPDGRPIAVSGVVIRPAGRNPPEGRPVVAWAHPTTGVARKCAPSLIPNVLTDIPGLLDMLHRGWVIAATDYPGLGTAGIHPYLVGVSEAHAVLEFGPRRARHCRGRRRRPLRRLGPLAGRPRGSVDGRARKETMRPSSSSSASRPRRRQPSSGRSSRTISALLRAES